MSDEITRRTVIGGAAGLGALSATKAGAAARPAPFTAHLDRDILKDLRKRIERTRLPQAIADSGWSYGADLDAISDLLDRWRGFDWPRFEARLNALPQFTADIEGQTIHFIHARAAEVAATPLLLLHGWPSSVIQFLEIISRLTAAGFDVVAPSLPGFGFSSQPAAAGMSVRRMGELFSKLMTETLGYARYAARGSDLGAGAIQQMALARPQDLIGVHLSGTNPYVAYRPDNMNADEQAFVQRADQWMQSEMAYAQIHSTKPQTAAFALNDSPAGLAAWIYEKFHAWTDRKQDVIGRYGEDALLGNLTLYWATATIGSSMRLYYETARDQGAQWGRVSTPTAMLMSPHDMFPTPRAWAERSWNIVRWTETDRGGHFLEWEEPQLVADDIAASFDGGA